MWAGWLNLVGSERSRNGRSPGSRRSPSSQSHWRVSALPRLATIVPKMSEYDSFMAPDWNWYSSRAVLSVTPWKISCATTSTLIDRERSLSFTSTWPYTICWTSGLQKALTHCLGPGLSASTTQLMVETMAPPLSSMLSRSSTVRRKSDTATALAWALTASGVQSGGLTMPSPGSPPSVVGSLNPKSKVCTLWTGSRSAKPSPSCSQRNVRSTPKPSVDVCSTPAPPALLTFTDTTAPPVAVCPVAVMLGVRGATE